MAPQVGLEPTTLRLTAGCSAIELLRSGSTLACALELSTKSYQRPQLIGNARVIHRFFPERSQDYFFESRTQHHCGLSRLPRRRVRQAVVLLTYSSAFRPQ